MKHQEYDSPFELTISDITNQMARDIDEMSWKAIQRVGINVDKEKLLTCLKQDANRYRKAYANGYDTGYEKRDDEIVRCKDCKWVTHFTETGMPVCHSCRIRSPEWFCADGVRKDD